MSAGMNMTLQQAAQAVHGKLQGADVSFSEVSTDSRALSAGALFIALQGEHFDAHDFVAQAAAQGAVAAMVAHPVAVDVPQIIVADTRLALGALAAAWRQSLPAAVVAVTGSNGKTTTKEMLAAILSQAGEVLATRGNLNNDIGVPLTLLRLRPQHRYAVIEMGANHPGEIAYLTALAKPEVALITNAASAHLAGFGDLEGVARAKGEIYQGLDEAGVAVINADDAHAALWRLLAHGYCTLSFGLEQAADVQAHWAGDAGGSRIQVQAGDSGVTIRLPLPGRHNVLNALAAITAAMALGIDLDVIRHGLEGMAPVESRLQLKPGLNGARIIDDTYNANPDSLQAGLAVLATCAGEKYLALGDMGELGEQACSYHTQAAAQAREAGVDRLYAVGELTRKTVTAFGDNGRHFANQTDLIAALKQDLHPDVTLLVKGSRAMHMEQVVAAVCREQEGAHAALSH